VYDDLSCLQACDEKADNKKCPAFHIYRDGSGKCVVWKKAADTHVSVSHNAANE
jgi:hypothetical protein